MLKKFVALLLAIALMVPAGTTVWAEENGNDMESRISKIIGNNSKTVVLDKNGDRTEYVSVESEQENQAELLDEFENNDVCKKNIESVSGENFEQPENLKLNGVHTETAGVTADYDIYQCNVDGNLEMNFSWTTSADVANCVVSYNKNLSVEFDTVDFDNKTAVVKVTSDEACLSDLTFILKDEDNEIIDYVVVEVLFTVDCLGYYQCGSNCYMEIDQIDEQDWNAYIVGSGVMYGYSSADDTDWYGHHDYFDSLTFGSSIESAGKYCFYNWNYLKTVILPDYMETVGFESFGHCDNLQGVYFSEGILSINAYAFDYCYKLETVLVSNSNSYYTVSNGVLFDKDMTTLVLYPSSLDNGTTYIIPNSVMTIGDDAFCDNLTLVDLIVPQSVSNIGDYAFENSEIDKIAFCGNVPEFSDSHAFSNISVDIYYPNNSYSWSTFAKQNEQYGGTVNWSECTINSDNLTVSAATIDKQYQLNTFSNYGKLYYTSNNSSIQVSDQGVVTVSKNYAGSATITITTGGDDYRISSKQIKVTVKRINNSVNFMFSNKTITVSASARNYTNKASANGVPISYSSTNSKLRVNANGVVSIPAYYIGATTVTARADVYGIYNAASRSYKIVVNPAQGKLTSVKSVKNSKGKNIGIKVTAYKGKVNVNYQFQISDTSKFTKNVRSYSGTQLSRSIKASANKTWYVRVRCYKVSKNGTKNATFYGKWSTAKKIKL